MRFFLFLLAVLVLAGCQGTGSERVPDGTLNIVATTSMLADLARTVGGDAVTVTGLMGPGVDPHLYKASEGDVSRMAGADLILYNGLHLEGKMAEVLEQMGRRDIRTEAVAEVIAPEKRLASSNYAGNHDPHIWFDVSLWQEAAAALAEILAAAAPAQAATFRSRADAYQAELDSLDAYVRARLAEVPEAQRILITSHDAFGYFGRAYGFEVRGLQGLSTATEAGTADVQALVDLVVARQIPAMFVESSVSERGIRAVREAVQAQGFEVRIGGTLYGDALGDAGTPEGTYLGMVRHNVDTIVAGLTPAAP